MLTHSVVEFLQYTAATPATIRATWTNTLQSLLVTHTRVHADVVKCLESVRNEVKHTLDAVAQMLNLEAMTSGIAWDMHWHTCMSGRR